MRPVKEIADAIQRQDAKWLTTLPGRRRGHRGTDHRHAAPQGDQVRLDARRRAPATAPPTPAATGGGRQRDGGCVSGAVSVGHSPAEARNRLDKVLAGGKTFKTVEEMLLEIYKQERKSHRSRRASA